MTGHTAGEALASALEEVRAAGLFVPCAGSDSWTCDDAEERRIAATLCDGCPVFAECEAVAVECKPRDIWGVWAGTDRSWIERPRKAGAA